jgi:hypothetical protein
MRPITRRDALTRTAAFIATVPALGPLVPHEPAAAAPDLLPDYLAHNIAYVMEHLAELADPDLIEIDNEFFLTRLDNPTARAAEAAWRDAYRAMQNAIDAEAPHLRPLLDRMGDAGGDLAAMSEIDGRDRGIALACSLRPPRTDPLDLDISTWDAFQLFPVPGSVPDAEAISAAVIDGLHADLLHAD